MSRRRAARARGLAALALTVTTAVIATSGVAGADEPSATVGAEATRPVTWRATRGTVARGRLPGSLILASDGAPGRYSVGELISAEEIALPYRVTVTWRRLGGEGGRSMHVLVAGGVVLIKAGRINFYAYDDAAFAAVDWQPLAAASAQDEHTVVVTQDARAVVVEVDGAPAARYPVTVRRARAHVGVGMKAAPGHRSKLYLRALAVGPTQ